MDNAHPFEKLTPDFIIDAIESLGLYCDGRILALNSYENRVYQVGIEDKTPIVVKFYRPNRWTTAQIAEEHDFSYELLGVDLPVVVPEKLGTENTLFTYQEFEFSVFERKGGRAPELDNLDNLYIMGQTLGRMHSVGSAKAFKYRPTLDIESFGIQSVDYLLKHFIPDSLRASYEGLCTDLINKINAAFSKAAHAINPIRLHGDCHMGNILWRDDMPHFVDFDDARMAPAIQDIWMLLSGERHEKLSQLSEIVDGYDEFSEFPHQQLQLIEPLRTLRMMHYAAWLGRRWQDPAFPQNFPWFNTERYWGEHILQLKEQSSELDLEPLELVR